MQIPTIFDAWGITEENPCTWQYFRDNLNAWLWKMQDREKLQETVDKFYSLSFKYRMQGKLEESKKMATKALRLEGSLTKCKPIEIP